MATASTVFPVALTVFTAQRILFYDDITHTCHSECPTWKGTEKIIFLPHLFYGKKTEIILAA